MKNLALTEVKPEDLLNTIHVTQTDTGVKIYYFGDNIPAEDLPDEVVTRNRISNLVNQYAFGLRSQATKGISPAEMSSWPIKRAEAQKFIVTNDPLDAPLLSVEATARNIALESIVARVLVNAESLGQLEASISGVAGKHRDTLEGMSTLAMLNYDYKTGWPL